MAEDNQRAEGTAGLAALPVQSAPASWAQFPHQSAAINTSSPRPDKGRAGSPLRADFSAGVSMESFVYPPFSTYQSFRAGLTPHGGRDPVLKQPSWKQSKSTGLGPFPGTPTPLPSDYLDSCHRAHLKALLSQVSPGLTPRLRRANTREIGVQVNPRADAAVQCSLGPRTLPAGRPLSPAGLYARGRMALYSPVLDRRLFTMPEAAGFREKDEVAAASPEKQKAEDGGRKQQDGQAAAAPLTEGQSKASQEEAAAPGRQAAFQFLEQKYGYFHCKDCKTRWESAYVWCISGSNKVYFKQFCRKCQKGYNPYRVEAIQCQTCSKTRCSCPQKKRHIDLKRPHRQELCGRCRGKRLSCDNTYSFKYIV
ncbi:protein ZAR1-like [Anas platyrhynchos]